MHLTVIQLGGKNKSFKREIMFWVVFRGWANRIKVSCESD